MPCPEVAERSPPIRPGTTQLTVMPWGANSDASARVNPIKAGLAGGDMQAAGRAEMRADAADIDDASVFVPHHVRQHRARAEKRAVEDDAEDVVPFLERHFERRRLFADGRVVHQDVDPPEGRDRLVRHGCDGGLVGDVGEMHERARAGRLDLLRHAFGLLPRGAGVDDHRRALAREGQRHGAADAPHAAGDDGDLTFESVFLVQQFLHRPQLAPRPDPRQNARWPLIA